MKQESRDKSFSGGSLGKGVELFSRFLVCGGGPGLIASTRRTILQSLRERNCLGNSGEEKEGILRRFSQGIKPIYLPY